MDNGRTITPPITEKPVLGYGGYWPTMFFAWILVHAVIFPGIRPPESTISPHSIISLDFIISLDSGRMADDNPHQAVQAQRTAGLAGTSAKALRCLRHEPVLQDGKRCRVILSFGLWSIWCLGLRPRCCVGLWPNVFIFGLWPIAFLVGQRPSEVACGLWPRRSAGFSWAAAQLRLAPFAWALAQVRLLNWNMFHNDVVAEEEDDEDEAHVLRSQVPYPVVGFGSEETSSFGTGLAERWIKGTGDRLSYLHGWALAHCVSCWAAAQRGLLWALAHCVSQWALAQRVSCWALAQGVSCWAAA